jgi:RNA-binding protein YlmH
MIYKDMDYKDMDKETSILFARFADLFHQCETKNQIVCTEFLSVYEQTIFQQFAEQNKHVQYELTGGYELAERKIVCFLPVWEDVETFSDFPFRVIRISPKCSRFVQECTHRDYLGALMSLGLERNRFGDVIVHDHEAFVVCKEEILSYVCKNLRQVRHMFVVCRESDFENLQFRFQYQTLTGTVASLRLDCIIAFAFRLSRGKVIDALRAEKIFINGRVALHPDYLVKEGDILSLRNYGKCKFISVDSRTKKGREVVTLYKYVN